MKVKNVLSIFIVIIIALLLGSTNVEASLRLKELDFDVRLNDDGSMDVTETWDISISETNTLYKTFKIDKNKYDSISNFSVKEITAKRNNKFTESRSWQYHLPKDYYFGGINQDNEYEVSWGVGLDDSSDTRQYEIKYTVIGAVHKYGDCAELYWQLLGENFQIPANKITGTIKLPSSVDNKKDIRVWGHTEDLNGEINVTDNDTVEFELTNYRANRYVEVRITTPPYIFWNVYNENYEDILDDIIEEEVKWTEEANARRAQKEKNSIIFVSIEIGIIAVLCLIVIRNMIKYIKRLHEIKNSFKITKLEYYRELPDDTANPSEAMFILSKYVDTSKALSSTLLNLALKKYIELSQQGKDIYITILNSDDQYLKRDEKEVLSLLERVKSIEKLDKITMKQLEKFVRKYPKSIKGVIKGFTIYPKEAAEEKGKFDSEIEKESLNIGVHLALYFVAIMFIMFFGVFSGIFISESLIVKAPLITGLISAFMILVCSIIIDVVLVFMLLDKINGLTEKGLNEQEQWKAFKKYMVDFSLLKEKEVPALALWEKYLVFATAFGVADKVIKQLKVAYPELNNQDTIRNMVIFNTFYDGSSFNTNFINSINSSTASINSTYSSSTGGGGGFSGGGGGRWPVVDGGGGR